MNRKLIMSLNEERKIRMMDTVFIREKQTGHVQQVYRRNDHEGGPSMMECPWMVFIWQPKTKRHSPVLLRAEGFDIVEAPDWDITKLPLVRVQRRRGKPNTRTVWRRIPNGDPYLLMYQATQFPWVRVIRTEHGPMPEFLGRATWVEV